MTAYLPPDRLRAMARAIYETDSAEQIVEQFDDGTYRSEIVSFDDYEAFYPEGYEGCFAAAQACWEASPGGELMEALEPFAKVADAIDFRAKQLGCVISEHARWEAATILVGNYWRAREALRQALPQGTET